MRIDQMDHYTKDLSPERRELLRLLLAEKAKAKQAAEAEKRVFRQAIPRRDPAAPAVLSLAQERFWFLDQLNPGNPVYSVPAVVRLTGRLDVPVLTRALTELMRRNQTLRTSFAVEQGRPVQVVAQELVARLPLIDLSGLTAGSPDEHVSEVAGEYTRAPFDLSRPPLFRMTLLRLGAEEHVALLAIHHIISDQWSINILVQELAVLYGAFLTGRPSPLPEPSIQYVDFAAWQRQWLREAPLDKDLDFWKRALAGAPAALDLPTDRPRPAVQSFWGAKRFIAFPPELNASLKSLSRGEGASLFMTILAAFYVLLFRTTGADDIVVGTSVANRNRPELERVMGPLLNTLLLRGDMTGNPTFHDLLARVREMTVEAFQHQDLPFERLLEELQPERTMSRNALFQAALVLLTAPRGELRAPGLTFTPFDIDAGTLQIDLTLLLAETSEGGLTGWLEYDTDLFHRPSIDRQIGHLRSLLEEVARDPGQRLRALPMLSPQELQQVVWDWNDTDAPYERELTIPSLFERQVARTPDALAAECGPARLTYAELNAQANQLAHHLIDLGVGHGLLVGLHMGRGLHNLVALLGVLKAGGAYVPIDVGQPLARIEAIVQTAGIEILVTETSRAETVRGLGERLRQVVWLDTLDVAGQPVTDPGPRVDSETLAYVIYTSGSTGTPKGVMVRHRPAINLIDWVNRTFEVGPDDRLLFVSSPVFDLSVYDVFGLLAAGGSVRVASEAELRDPESLVRILLEEPITFWDSAPAALQQLVPFLPSAPAPRAAFGSCSCRGDWIPVALPDRVRARLPGSAGGEPRRRHRGHGVVELLPRRRGRSASGRASPTAGRSQNARYHVLDAELGRCPIGVAGRPLHRRRLPGSRLSRAAGAARPTQFVPDPFTAEPACASTAPATCALSARRQPGVPGPPDHQVKIRGFRIELGEIEAAWPSTRRARGGGGGRTDRAARSAWSPMWSPRRRSAGRRPDLRAWLAGGCPSTWCPPPSCSLDGPAAHRQRQARPQGPAGAASGTPRRRYVAPRSQPRRCSPHLGRRARRSSGIGVATTTSSSSAATRSSRPGWSRASASASASSCRCAILFEAPTVGRSRGAGRASGRARRRRGRRAAAVAPAPRRTAGCRSPSPRSACGSSTSWSRGAPAYNVAGRAAPDGPARCRRPWPRPRRDRRAATRSLRTRLRRRWTASRVQVIAAALPLAAAAARPRAACRRRARAPSCARLAARRGAAARSTWRAGRCARPPGAPGGRRARRSSSTSTTSSATAGRSACSIRELAALYAAFAAGRPSPLPRAAGPVRRLRRLAAELAARRGPGAAARLLAASGSPARRRASSCRRPAAAGRPDVRGGACRFDRCRRARRAARRARAGARAPPCSWSCSPPSRPCSRRYAARTTWSSARRSPTATGVEIEGLIGFFVNTLVLRADLAGEPAFARAARRGCARPRSAPTPTRTCRSSAWSRSSQPERDLSRTPLFQVMFDASERRRRRRMELPGLDPRPRRERRAGRPSSTSTLDPDRARRRGSRGALELQRPISSTRATIDRLLGHFATLLGSDRRPSPTGGCRELAAAARGRAPPAALASGTTRRRRHAGESCLHELFGGRSRRTPEAVAVVCRRAAR